jgi:flavin reductase (DIM6/NTAB) family NADH-FMN oxidoreductase RutF
MEVTAERFVAAMRCHPEGVTVVTAADELGNAVGMTATAFAAVSLDPPLVLVCVDKRATILSPLRAGAHFAVHFLAGGQERLARAFAQHALEGDKFAGASFEMSFNGSPRLGEALAWIECAPHDIVPGGDHTIVVGRVIDVHIDEAVDTGLVFFDGAFAALRRRPREGP